ncbi:lipase [Lysinibacter cavernae]|uniref:Lipase n=1 Tax=Lysinibacter cavernae TaxID=1640652 RepID=A0A7X5TU29_9MICO|nr:lipase [Lysinibacter cavernae]NIH55251.1 hypothetical protein [Lysinibacter cavernae]
MKASGKNVIVAVVSALTISLTASPAYAAGSSSSVLPATLASVTQGLDVTSIKTTAMSIDSFEIVIDGVSTTSVNDAGHHFDVAATIEAAVSEVGSTRPTGWNQPGECIMSAQRWIRAGGGTWNGSGNPVSNYAGAAKIDIDDVTAGDVIQYQYASAPTAWATGVHTVLVVGTNADGTLTIVESNNPGGSGLVGLQQNWKPAPPSGFEAVGWRF